MYIKYVYISASTQYEQYIPIPIPYLYIVSPFSMQEIFPIRYETKTFLFRSFGCVFAAF